jgi:hypothetical protein
MVPFDRVYTEDNLRVLKHSYLPYPPEYKIFALFYKNVCLGSKPCPYYKEVYDTYVSFGADRYQSLLKFHTEADIEKGVKSLYNWTVKHKDRLVQSYLPWVEKVDPYSVGMCMVMVDRWLDEESAMSTSFKNEYIRLVKDLTQVHPKQRMNARQALKRVQKILKMK